MEFNSVSQADIAKRLLEYIQYDAITTPSQFAAKAGIDASGFHKMLKGQLKITTTTLKKIAVTYGLNMSWLLTGEGDMIEAKPVIDMTRHNSAGDNAGGDIFKIFDAPALESEDKTICDLKKEVEHLKALLAERERVITEKERFIQHLLRKQ